MREESCIKDCKIECEESFWCFLNASSVSFIFRINTESCTNYSIGAAIFRETQLLITKPREILGCNRHCTAPSLAVFQGISSWNRRYILKNSWEYH
jgi:hypothetical protein